MARNFRQLSKFLTPYWLHTGEGEKVLWATALLQDLWVTRARALIESRFPSRAGDSALALLSNDRGIPRGRDETSAHFAQRLIRWRSPRGHRCRGSAFALLEQVSEYFGGIRCATVDFKGNYHERSAAGVESYSYGYAWEWDGTPSTPVKARFWLILYLPAEYTAQPLIGDPALWDGAIGTPGFTIGQTTATHGDALALRKLFRGRAWKPAGTKAIMAVVSLDGSTPVPDGNWGTWGGRDPNFRYWDLT